MVQDDATLAANTMSERLRTDGACLSRVQRLLLLLLVPHGPRFGAEICAWRRG